ncbi:hypothetical protein L2E82_10519 [Cichorium intybus]|uniref:Uncharacterized protein n=1 Tax=Cichorium intybus TaxID=13427 RepID=A0ACB9GCT3_CICIN|nr:hypothetical protein L2E82_10519 [Cichorium intybus]
MTRNPHSRRVRNCKGSGGFRMDGEDDEGEEHAKSTEVLTLEPHGCRLYTKRMMQRHCALPYHSLLLSNNNPMLQSRIMEPPLLWLIL